MTGAVVFPLMWCLAIIVAVTGAHRRLPPRLAARVATVGLVIVTLAMVPTALVVASAFLAHVPIVGVGFQWCARTFGAHGAIPTWVGVPVVAMVGIGVWRTCRVVRQYLRLRIGEPDSVHLLPSHRPYAVTLPGRAVVISTAMIDLLDADEREIVLAHEHAHARLRHERYLLVAELAAAACPPLRSIARRVNYSLERWADDAAAAVCGDRKQVAVTLGKIALLTGPSSAGVLGFAGLGVSARMNALLAPPIAHPHRRYVFTLWAMLAAACAMSFYQLHHLESLLAALCPH